MLNWKIDVVYPYLSSGSSNHLISIFTVPIESQLQNKHCLWNEQFLQIVNTYVLHRKNTLHMSFMILIYAWTLWLLFFIHLKCYSCEWDRDFLNCCPYQHHQLQLVFYHHTNLTAELAARHGPDQHGNWDPKSFQGRLKCFICISKWLWSCHSSNPSRMAVTNSAILYFYTQFWIF